MKIALAQTILRLNDRAYNLKKMLHSIEQASAENCDLLIFGEASLCGFEAMVFDDERDLAHALTMKAPEILQLREACKKNHLGLGFGGYFREDKTIYAGYLVLDKWGEVAAFYRRMSPGWKIAAARENPHYAEGEDVVTFSLEDLRFTIMICGDFWIDELVPRYQSVDSKTDAYLWPVHCDYSAFQWEEEHEADYCKRSELLSKPIFFINNESDEANRATGGAYVWKCGETLASRKPGAEGLLIYEL